jgi:hypothetical protein
VALWAARGVIGSLLLAVGAFRGILGRVSVDDDARKWLRARPDWALAGAVVLGRVCGGGFVSVAFWAAWRVSGRWRVCAGESRARGLLCLWQVKPRSSLLAVVVGADLGPGWSSSCAVEVGAGASGGCWWLAASAGYSCRPVVVGILGRGWA